jgi:D-alanyl-D-alanine carboxypeptidase (penicillin-binding protein 5/6)
VQGLRPPSILLLGAILALGAAGVARARPASAGPGLDWVVPGRPASLAWPRHGQAAVAVAGVGVVGASPGEHRVPIASVTKMMTALVVLADHPLGPGGAGPTISIGPRDVVEWRRQLRAGDSVVEVRDGEELTEFQALEALLIPSADNVADRLAVWDAGSIPAFVGKMNALARADGLGQTHYADPSGLDPRSASTAADQAYVAGQLMAYPVVRAIVRRRRINLPVVGILPNRNPALGIDGIVGVKGGFTSHAHTCLVTAAYRLHHAALVISVALGQADPLAAARVDESILEAATRSLEQGRPGATRPGRGAIPLSPAVAGISPRVRVRAVAVWPGLVLKERVAPAGSRGARAQPGAEAERADAELTISAPWGTVDRVPVRLADPRAHGARG